MRASVARGTRRKCSPFLLQLLCKTRDQLCTLNVMYLIRFSYSFLVKRHKFPVYLHFIKAQIKVWPTPIFQAISCAYNPGNGRNSQCWSTMYFPVLWVYRGTQRTGKCPTHSVNNLALRQQKYHMVVSVGEQGMGRSKNLIFCSSTPQFCFNISPRELVNHFHKQVPETQRRTILPKSLQSGSNTAACHHCQKSSGWAW